MKKLFSVLPVILLVMILSACGKPQTDVSVWQEEPTVAQENTSLTVFCMGGLKDSSMIELAFNRYRDLHPDVSLELIMPESDATNQEANKELYQQVAAQIMAGEGPDVFIIDDTVMDVEKLVRQGHFADMEPFFEADNFDWKPYNQTVMDGGVWNGKRFVIPLSYDFPLLITSRTALEETGFDITACKDYMGFQEETTRYLEDTTQTRQLFRNVLMITDVVPISGISVVDYDTQSIDLTSSTFQAGYQWRKTVEQRCLNNFGDFQTDASLCGAAAVRDGHVLWSPAFLSALSGFYNEFSAIKTIDEAVMMPIRDISGGIQAKIKYPVAVRANSGNLQNSYDFIKILLSSEVQCAVSSEELSVLDSANEYFYQETSQGKVYYISAGVNGFTSTTDQNQAVDWPSSEEFQQFVGFTQEISGTYYSSRTGLNGAMYPFLYEDADYAKTIDSAKRKLEIYLSE